LQSASDKFKLRLKYEEDNEGLSQWNGNIDDCSFSHEIDNNERENNLLAA